MNDLFKLELTPEEKILAEKHDNLCLLKHIDDPRTMQEALEEFNVAHHTDIDYNWCSAYLYTKLDKALAEIAGVHKQIIIIL